jgi:glycopeptide antibiotics resistance protein
MKIKVNIIKEKDGVIMGITSYLIMGAANLARALTCAACIYVVGIGCVLALRGRKTVADNHFYARELVFLLYIIAVGFVTGLIGTKWSLDLSSAGFYTQLFTNESVKMILLNVMMFMPLGVLLPMEFRRLRRWYLVVPLGAAASAFIELSQTLFIGRFADIDDLVANTLGCALGYVCYAIAARAAAGHTGRKNGTGTFALVLAVIVVALGILNLAVWIMFRFR